MNAYFGGDLYQDLPTEYDCRAEHHMQPPYDRAIHKIEVRAGSLLADIIGAGTYGVNSYHHQAIRRLAENLDAMAVSEDGLIEAVSVKGKTFIMGVQWHPEFSYEVSEESVKLIQAFVDASASANK